ncbi:MAG: 3'-5' exonuclease [Rhodococcus sp. (in: high G+C Gram-positive bacteria)]
MATPRCAPSHRRSRSFLDRSTIGRGGQSSAPPWASSCAAASAPGNDFAAPRRTAHATDPDRVEHLHITDGRAACERRAQQVRFHRRHHGRSVPRVDAFDQPGRLARLARNEGQFPDFRAQGDEEILAERRTFYVAVTRPSRMLLVTRAAARQTRLGIRPTDASTFLGLLSATGEMSG